VSTAARNGHIDLCRALVKKFGADVNKATHDRRTPLMEASHGKHEAVAVFLIKNGADAQASSRFGTAGKVSKDYGAPAKQTAYLEARTHCANPGCDGAGRKKCGVCLEVWFCCKECQVAHWPAHKAQCKEVAARAKAAEEE
jgi:ankyrin repeat protein